MTLVTEKQLNTDELVQEFYTELFDGTLTQARYDEIIKAVWNDLMPEALAGMVAQGETSWKAKYFKMPQSQQNTKAH